MPNPYHYRAVINRLASLADAPNPPQVQVAAAGALARELSPANPRHALSQRMLHAVDAFEFARHKLRDLYDTAAPLSPDQPRIADVAGPEEEEPTQELDDPL